MIEEAKGNDMTKYSEHETREEQYRHLEAELAATQKWLDAEHEAYVDLFHQLSAYEKREIAERANAQLVIHALTFYRNKYEQFGQGYVGCASDALAAIQEPVVAVRCNRD